MKILLVIFVGGGLGSVLRYLVGRLALMAFPTAFPWGTLLANVASCAVLGFALLALGKEQLQGYWIPFLIIGFCGGFSTFSTFSYETLLLVQQGKWMWAGLNIAVSIVSCLLILMLLTRQMQ